MVRLIHLIAAFGIVTSAALAQNAREPVGLIGEIRLPTEIAIGGFPFGGISGLDYDPHSGLFYAISDDRAEFGPARFYKLRLDYTAAGITKLDIVDTVMLRTEGGAPFARGDVDPEGISLDPRTGLLVWASEGDLAGNPAIIEAGIDGYLRRRFELPAYYLSSAEGTGIRDNASFEGLSHTPDGKVLFAALESSLRQDGPPATLDEGSLARVLAFDPQTARPVAEYAYRTAPVPRAATGLRPADNGVSAILALDEKRLLVVERSFAAGYGNTIQVFEASLDGATDVLGRERIAGSAFEPLAKKHLFTLEEGTFGLDMDNIEGITFGPDIDGRRTLVLASDNNFNPRGQVTQFIVLAFDP
ncbi:esterase-like activity of phytase family protein [Pseudochelatococcus sp. B33]